jgi:hypothetical protein
MPRKVSLRRVAWVGAGFGAWLMIVGWLLAPAKGSNYPEELAEQAWRIEVGMWVGAGIGIGFPAFIWLLQAACSGLGGGFGEPASPALESQHSDPCEGSRPD